MRPVIEARVQSAFDQQRAKAGAVEEDVAFDRGPIFETKRSDVTVVTIDFDLGDPPLDAVDPVGLRHAAQEPRIKRGIQLVGIVHPLAGQMGELACQRGDQLQAIIVVGSVVAAFFAVHPEMLESSRPVILPGYAEGVEIAIGAVAPAVEQYAELEGRLRRTHEIRLSDPEDAVESRERGDGRFTDADGADGIGFDKRHRDCVPHGPRNRGGGHPPGRSPAGYDDLLGFGRAHAFPSCVRMKLRMRDAVCGVSGASTPRAFSGMCAVTSSPFSNT